MVNVESLPDAYTKRFPGSRPRLIARAPGRVNLIGEHVDYNDGLVLPAAIERSTYVVIGPGEANTLTVHSATLSQTVEIDLANNPPPNPPMWDAYVRGVVHFVGQAGVRVGAANVYIDSDVPFGSGLSSSAALEVATAMGLVANVGENLPGQQVAKLCQQAERVYARVPCGIMDQTASARALSNSAMLLDCRNLHIRHIPWPSDDVAILIVDSRVEHRLVDSPYAQRVDECRRALAQIRELVPRVTSMRDVTPRVLLHIGTHLDKLLLKRATHVATEVQRTSSAAAALERGDFATMGKLMNQSHESLRDNYEVSAPHLDELVRLLWDTPTVYGARVTGGGFGGCVVALVQRDGLAEIENVIRQRYDVTQRRPAQLLVTRPGAGASVTRL